MSIGTSIKYIKFLFGENNFDRTGSKTFRVTTGKNKRVTFLYDQRKNIIKRTAINYLYLSNFSAYHRVLDEKIEFNEPDNTVKYSVAVNVSSNKFSKDVLFTGVSFGSHIGSSITYLNVILKKEYDRVLMEVIKNQ